MTAISTHQMPIIETEVAWQSFILQCENGAYRQKRHDGSTHLVHMRGLLDLASLKWA